MVVLLSALLVSLPNIRLFENKQMPTEGEQVSIRRSLLSDLQATEEDLNMEEFLIFKDDEPEFDSKLIDDDNSTGKEFAKILNNLGKFHCLLYIFCYVSIFVSGKKYEDHKIDKNSFDKLGLLSKIMQTMKSFMMETNPKLLEIKSTDFGGTYNKNGFIEPDIDDYQPGDEGPPLKRARILDVDNYRNINPDTVVASTITNQVTKDK